MPPARVCHGSLHGAETSFQLTLALWVENVLWVCKSCNPPLNTEAHSFG